MLRTFYRGLEGCCNFRWTGTQKHTQRYIYCLLRYPKTSIVSFVGCRDMNLGGQSRLMSTYVNRRLEYLSIYCRSFQINDSRERKFLFLQRYREKSISENSLADEKLGPCKICGENIGLWKIRTKKYRPIFHQFRVNSASCRVYSFCNPLLQGKKSIKFTGYFKSREYKRSLNK